MICKMCADKKHPRCANIWSGNKKRQVPTKTHCDCQHKPSWNYVKKNEGNNGDGSES